MGSIPITRLFYFKSGDYNYSSGYFIIFDICYLSIHLIFRFIFYFRKLSFLFSKHTFLYFSSIIQNYNFDICHQIVLVTKTKSHKLYTENLRDFVISFINTIPAPMPPHIPILSIHTSTILPALPGTKY